MAATSSNLVKINFIKEAVLKTTPGAGNFRSPRFTSESFSGTPLTVISELIRDDRLSSGQVLTGVNVEGTLETELSAEEAIHDLVAGAMFNDWVVSQEKTVNMALNAAAGTLTRAAGSFITEGFKVGDVVKLSGYANALNNVTVVVVKVTATIITFFGRPFMVTQAGSAQTKIKRMDNVTIGTDLKSFSFERIHTDLNEKGINYRGVCINRMMWDINWGELIKSSFEFMGAEQQSYDDDANSMSQARTVEDQGTEQVLNGSVDLILGVDLGNGFTANELEIEKMSMTLNNNLNPKNIIGAISPEDFSGGTAQVEISITAHINNDNWDVIEKKLTQDPISICGITSNDDGGYGLYMPAVQLTFPDPHSVGQNENLMLEMTGVAKVGDDGGSSLILSKF